MPSRSIGDTAQRTFVAAVVLVAVVVAALALWKLRMLVSLLFLGFIIAAAMRPGVDALARRRIPRSAGVAVHYVALAGLVALFLWFVVPRALSQLQIAIGDVPTTRSEVHEQAKHSTGIKHEILVGIDRRLRRAPTVTDLVHPALDTTRAVLEILIGIFFVFATAAYWIFERERAERVVLCLLPARRRRVVRETWNLVDLKLGAYVRGSLLLILFVSTVLSVAFWLIGLPYWMLLGTFAGLVEIIPVVGPLAAGVLAVGVGLTVSLKTAALAAVAVYGLRLFQDYVLHPRGRDRPRQGSGQGAGAGGDLPSPGGRDGGHAGQALTRAGRPSSHVQHQPGTVPVTVPVTVPAAPQKCPVPGRRSDPGDEHILVDARAQIERFLDSPALGEATRRAYRFDLEAFEDWLQAQQVSLGDVDARVLADYAAHLGRGRPRRLAPSSLARKLAAVRALLRFSLGAERVPDISLSPRRRHRLPDAPRAAEVDTMLAGLDGEGPLGLRNRALVELVYSAGLRSAEATALDLSDVDYD